jgi:hypothetical protein
MVVRRVEIISAYPFVTANFQERIAWAFPAIRIPVFRINYLFCLWLFASLKNK